MKLKAHVAFWSIFDSFFPYQRISTVRSFLHRLDHPTLIEWGRVCWLQWQPRLLICAECVDRPARPKYRVKLARLGQPVGSGIDTHPRPGYLDGGAPPPAAYAGLLGRRSE